MGSVHQLAARTGGPPLGSAIDAFLGQLPNANTARSYRIALRALADEVGDATPVGALDDEAVADRLGAWFTARWGTAAQATANVRLDALRSAAGWWRGQGWLATDPFRRVRRRPRPPDRTRSIDRADIEAFLTRPDLALRERTFWRMLYETAARAEEVLALDVDELDLPNRRSRVRRKGGAADIIIWRTATARLLPRLLEGRSAGPVFLT